jgi:hypothetical protein
MFDVVAADEHHTSTSIDRDSLDHCHPPRGNPLNNLTAIKEFPIPFENDIRKSNNCTRSQPFLSADGEIEGIVPQ